MIVGIAAKARSGKDTFLDFMIRRHQEVGNDFNKRFVKHSFAAPLKDFCDELFGFTEEHREGKLKEVKSMFKVDLSSMKVLILEHFKNHPTTPINDFDKASKIGSSFLTAFSDKLFIRVFNEAHFCYTSPREVYQLFGTDIFRQNWSDSFWIDYLKQYDLNEVIVGVPDVRFENEAKLVRQLGGQLIHLQRLGVEQVLGHSSENGVSVIEDDAIIQNNSSLEILRTKAINFYDENIGVVCGKKEEEEIS